MEFDEAAKMMEVRNPVSADELGDLLVAHHSGRPQAEALARGAVAMIREGLARLASLGHQLHLVEHDPSQAVVRFPQMLYKAGDGGAVVNRIVESQDEFDEAEKDGWSAEQPASAVAPAAAPVAPSIPRWES